MQYEVSAVGRSNVFGIYDNFGGGFVCKRGRKPLTTLDAMKAARAANRLNALIDFGATQSDAWRYAQTVFDLTQGAATNAEP